MREKGVALAFTAIAVAAAWLVAVSLAMTHRPDHRADRGGRVPVARLKTGECFTGLEKTAADRLVTVLPCTRPHDGEIAAQASLPDDDAYPGDEGISEEAQKVCTARFNFLAQSRYLDDLDDYVDEPTPFSGGIRRRTSCWNSWLPRRTGGVPGSLRSSVRSRPGTEC